MKPSINFSTAIGSDSSDLMKPSINFSTAIRSGKTDLETPKMDIYFCTYAISGDIDRPQMVTFHANKDATEQLLLAHCFTFFIGFIKPDPEDLYSCNMSNKLLSSRIPEELTKEELDLIENAWKTKIETNSYLEIYNSSGKQMYSTKK